MLNSKELESAKATRPYYYAMGLEHDGILRCKDCQKLVTHNTLKKLGACPRCGTRRVAEVRTLSGWEKFKIWAGFLRFPNSAEFLAEFSRVKE